MKDRIDGLADALRPGAPRKVTDEQVEVVVTGVVAETGSPAGTSPGQPGSLPELGVCVDPEFIAWVRDVVGLYMNRPSTPWSWPWTRSQAG